jgi:nicotinamidase-related amidase
MTISLLSRENTGLVIIDVQNKLAPVMGRKGRMVASIIKLIKLAELFNLPVILTEQFPKWLGPTISDIRTCLPECKSITKMEFNCCDVPLFNDRLEAEGLRNIILTGVESHVCVFQTCVSLLEKGYRVHVPRSAVDSRTEENLKTGFELMRGAGAVITSTEAVVFQILEKAGTKEFKEMMKLIR